VPLRGAAIIKTGWVIFCHKKRGNKIKSRAKKTLLIIKPLMKKGQINRHMSTLFKLNQRIFFLSKEKIPKMN
jgi:hypothetical protein